jgi:phosphoglucosamine mutase
VVDRGGRIFNGDELLFVMALDRLAQGEAVPGVVGTLMTNMAVELALKQRGVCLVRAKVGDRYVLEELSARGWALGGEGSGHLLALDRHTTGDGIVSALQILQAVRRTGRDLSESLQPVKLFPQVLLNVQLSEGVAWQDNADLAQCQRSVLEALGDQGRVLIRASGTEPVLRIMVEAREAALAQRCAQRLAQAARCDDGSTPDRVGPSAD